MIAIAEKTNAATSTTTTATLEQVEKTTNRRQAASRRRMRESQRAILDIHDVETLAYNMPDAAQALFREAARISRREESKSW